MKNTSYYKIIPVLSAFFVMGFCDIVGITSDYIQLSFGWSAAMTGFVPSMVFIWFFFLGIPIGNKMNKWGRKNTVIFSMIVTVFGMFLPLIFYSSITCIIAYMLLGIGNAILQISLNPLLGNVIKDGRLMTSSLTAGQVIKAISSLIGPEIVLFATVYFGQENWYYCFPILGCITLIFAFWLMLTPIEKEKMLVLDVSIKESFSLLKNKVILILFLGIFFIVGLDVATNYISSKLMSIRYDWIPEKTKFAPQIYFFCRTIGALLGTFLLTKISAIRYFRINIIACLIAVLTLIIVNHELISLISFGCIGFFASSIFSIIYSLAFKAEPSNINQISGLMITAVAGGGIVSPVLGVAVQVGGINSGLYVILCCVLFLIYSSYKTTI